MAIKNTYATQEVLPAADLNDIVTHIKGLGAYAQATPDMTLKIRAGVFNVNGVVVKYAGGNSPAFTAPGSNNRIDVLYLDINGTATVLQGTSGASPSAPDYPTNAYVICEVYLRSASTSLKNTDDATNGYIYRNGQTTIPPVIFSDTDGATVTFDLNVSNVHTVTLAGNRTLALSNSAVGKKFIIRLVQDGTGSRTVTWFSTLKWSGGSAPTLSTTAGKVDVFGFICTAANVYDGFVVGIGLS